MKRQYCFIKQERKKKLEAWRNGHMIVWLDQNCEALVKSEILKYILKTKVAINNCIKNSCRTIKLNNNGITSCGQSQNQLI